jgi:hypothetical protein
VLRGGSWNNNADNTRAATRNDNNPNNRNNNIGFRVVCLPRLTAPFLMALRGDLQCEAARCPHGCRLPEMPVGYFAAYRMRRKGR